jgi:uncharacterized protein (DUF885 family)
MKLHVVVLATLLVSVQALSYTQDDRQSDRPEFETFVDNFFQEVLRLNPLEATLFFGENRYNDLLHNNITPEYLAKEKAFYTDYLKGLGEYDKAELTREQKTTFDIVQWECETRLAGLKYPKHLMPIDQFMSTQVLMGMLASGRSAQPFRTTQDYENWLKRLDVFAAWCDTAIANMRKGMEQGIVLPKPLSEKVIPQLAGWKEGPVEEHHFYSPVKNLPENISEKEANQVRAKYKIMIEGKLIPVFNRLHDFFKNEYSPAGRLTAGFSALPHGAAWYQYLIEFYTTTDMSADEIFALGKAEVAQLESEMEKVKERVGFEGDIKAFVDYVRSRPELMPFDDPQQVIDNFNAIHERTKPNLEKLFDMKPKATFEVRRTEAFREASASPQYTAASLDGTRPGIFSVPIPDVNSYNVYMDEAVFVHEVTPGHYFQGSLAQENEDLSPFRRNYWNFAYGEGWALYCESLGKELGLYTDPYQYFGMLNGEMHRAIRLVVDTGLHAKGWTREQAIQYCLDHEAMPEARVISEIERYMAWPGQALSYKIGQLKIKELRKKASEKLGDKFNVREFHNKVLESGCVPLKVLEEKIDHWITELLEQDKPRMAEDSVRLVLIETDIEKPARSAKSEITQEDSKTTFADFLENYYQGEIRLFPLYATFDGDKRYNDLLYNDITPEYRAIIKAFYAQFLNRLGKYSKAELTEEERTSYDILKWQCEINLAELKYPEHLMPINQMISKHLTIGRFAGGASAQPFETKKDYDNWLKRVDGFIVWCDTAIANMQKGMEQGVVLPKALTQKLIPQFASWKDGPAENHHFYSPVKKLPGSMSEKEANEIRISYKVMIEGKLIPVINRLYDFIQNEYLPASRDTSGFSALPNGEAWYQHKIRQYTTTNLTADEVFALGKSEVARLKSEMEKVKEKVGFKGDLMAFFDHLRSKPELMPFDDPQQVIDNFNAIHERMKPNLEKLFDMMPKTAFEVRRTEAFREATASPAYFSGSMDGTRPGVFSVPIPDVTSYRVYRDEDLFLHEAIPGHHYQMSLSLENEALPTFRRIPSNPAYVEGWALYCESLGEELGLYTDPYQYFGMLEWDMHRAIRLVLDPGLHAKGWTREEAIQYSLDNEAFSEARIIADIERYMAIPGQALSYKIGQLKIQSLRKGAEEKLGDRFDIREFHNKVLESGCVPLKVLEEKIDRWIAELLEQDKASY